MSKKERLPPQLALGRFLNTVREEAATNSGFRSRLLEALDVEIYVDGEEEIETLDPIAVVTTKTETSFRRIYNQLNVAQLKRILRQSELATGPDLLRKSKPVLIDMLWARANNRATERGRG
jgi:hypothetical protein